MSAKLTLTTFAIMALAAAGCGDDGPDIVGLYQTTMHLENATGCTGGDTPLDSPPYFRIVDQDFAGQTFHTREDCTGTDPADCEDGSGLLSEEIDNGYEGWISFSSGSPSACTLGYVTYSAVLDGDTLTFENKTYSESGEIDPCDTDEAEARGTSMTCASYEIMVGTRQ